MLSTPFQIGVNHWFSLASYRSLLSIRIQAFYIRQIILWLMLQLFFRLFLLQYFFWGLIGVKNWLSKLQTLIDPKKIPESISFSKFFPVLNNFGWIFCKYSVKMISVLISCLGVKIFEFLLCFKALFETIRKL
ncbi:MAG: hypothetical protein Ta2E_08790 [Mycoplasmoidaceae bacterium]|nr:MAG: hypothetical protein Ta2E_08790 [Mycoplasmoidaceae bacterium]